MTDQNFIEIDELRLDREWLNQPRLYLEYSMKLAEAIRDLDTAKSRLEVVKAELDQDIRQNPQSHDIPGKITEGIVASAISRHRDYKKALKEVTTAKYEKDIMLAAVNALDHRKKALEKLVELHLASYFSEPSKPKSEEGRERMEEVERRATRKTLKNVKNAKKGK